MTTELACQPIDVGQDGLPTLTGYRQLYAIALERLAEDEPSWPLKRRQRLARDMAEAYCYGALGRVQRERGDRERRLTERRCAR